MNKVNTKLLVKELGKRLGSLRFEPMRLGMLTPVAPEMFQKPTVVGNGKLGEFDLDSAIYAVTWHKAQRTKMKHTATYYIHNLIRGNLVEKSVFTSWHNRASAADFLDWMLPDLAHMTPLAPFQAAAMFVMVSANTWHGGPEAIVQGEKDFYVDVEGSPFGIKEGRLVGFLLEFSNYLNLPIEAVLYQPIDKMWVDSSPNIWTSLTSYVLSNADKLQDHTEVCISIQLLRRYQDPDLMSELWDACAKYTEIHKELYLLQRRIQECERNRDFVVNRALVGQFEGGNLNAELCDLMVPLFCSKRVFKDKVANPYRRPRPLYDPDKRQLLSDKVAAVCDEMIDQLRQKLEKETKEKLK